jgi:hypothetical protein
MLINGTFNITICKLTSDERVAQNNRGYNFVFD